MIEFSKHSKERNKKRKISNKKIVETVRNPDEVKSSYQSRKLYRKQFGDKILEVVIASEHGKIIVVTQYYLENSYENKIRHKN